MRLPKTRPSAPALHQEIGNYIKTLEGEHHLKKTMENTDKMISSWWDRAVK